MRIILVSFFLFLTLSLSAQSYADFVNSAMDYVGQKDYVAAELAMKSALRKEPANPNNLMLMVNLGTIQRHLGKLEEALISYNVAVEAYPNKPFVLHNRAALYCEMNRFEDALLDYCAILDSNKEDEEALYRRGLIYIDKKDIHNAEADFKSILAMFSESLYGKMGMATLSMRRQQWKEAEEIYTGLLEKYKEKADLYYNRAECYLQQTKLAETQGDIKKAIELGYTDYPIYILRGRLRLAQYDRLLARQDFMKAQELGASEAVVNDYLKLCK